LKSRRVKAKKTRSVKIRDLVLGNNNPIAIQSMTTTKTYDWKSTVEQCIDLQNEKCDIIRVAVPDLKSSKAIGKIKKNISMPLVADIHFDHNLAIESLKNGADKIRINPGNIGSKESFEQIIKAAKKLKKAIRIGVNSGSMDRKLLEKYQHPTPEALVQSALNNINLCEKLGFKNVVISLKSTDLPVMLQAYRLFSKKSDYPVHVGMTEAGTLIPGITKNAIGIGTLLQEGIGDTIRVSMTADPVDQVKTAKEILKCLHLYHKEPTIISCPTCARTEIDVKKLAEQVTRRTAHIQKPLKITVLGCAVNGPGEAKEADYGIAGGREKGVIFKHGEIHKVVPESNLLDEFIELIESENA
jgi:(E)-4-hydroxy-3-methylbut-2-enyl-diphosphate synthase